MLHYGWDLTVDPGPQPVDAERNHSSAEDYPNDVDSYIREELSFECLVGPLPDDCSLQTFASPLGMVDTSNSKKRRTVTDCSQRRGNALLGINNWIPSDRHRGRPWKMGLPGMDEVRKASDRWPDRKIQLSKFDFTRYYHNWRICPSQLPYLAIQWRGHRYLDVVFSFGNLGAAMGAQRITNAISWIVQTQLPPGPGLQNSGLQCSCKSDCDCGDNGSAGYKKLMPNNKQTII